MVGHIVLRAILRDVGDIDPLLRGGVHVDIVKADGRAGNHFAVFHGLNYLGVDVGMVHKDHIRVPYQRNDLLRLPLLVNGNVDVQSLQLF